MSRPYAQELTRDDLINKYGITAVDPIGKVYNKDGEFSYVTIKSGKREYKHIATYDHIAKPKINIGKYGKGWYAYRSVTLGVHRIVWVWYNGIQHEGMVIDHIDNNPLNNNLFNLQEITQEENLAKDRKRIRKYKAVMCHDLDWCKHKLAEFTAKNEDAKARGDAEAAHKYRSSISKYKAQIRDWELHGEEYKQLIADKKANKQ